MDVKKWLEKPAGVTRAKGFSPFLSEEPSVLERLAELTYCNQGKSEIQGFGGQVIGMGAYGRMGLSVQEAFEFLHLIGCLDGFMLAVDQESESFEAWKDSIRQLVQDEVTRCEKEFMELNQKVERMLADGWTQVEIDGEIKLKLGEEAMGLGDIYRTNQ